MVAHALILATKLYIPPPPPKVVVRARLIERLDEGLHRTASWSHSCERTDNVQVAKVRLTVLNGECSEGQTLEQYEAALVNDTWWELETAAPIEGKFIVEAFDLAGNCTKHEA